MLRALVISAAALGLGATTVHAQAARDAGPDIGVTFGNTVMSIYPDGRSQKIWMHADGSWDGLSRRGVPLSGKWNMKGDKVCLRQSKPPTLPISFCQTLPKDPDIGLTSHDLTGQTIRLQIVKGITSGAGS